MYVSGGLIMNIIGFCKIKKRAKVCEVIIIRLFTRFQAKGQLCVVPDGDIGKLI